MCQFRRKINHKLPSLDYPPYYYCVWKSPQNISFSFFQKLPKHHFLSRNFFESVLSTKNWDFWVIFNHCDLWKCKLDIFGYFQTLCTKILITLCRICNFIYTKSNHLLFNFHWKNEWVLNCFGPVINVFSQITILCLHFQGQMGVIF